MICPCAIRATAEADFAAAQIDEQRAHGFRAEVETESEAIGHRFRTVRGTGCSRRDAEFGEAGAHAVALLLAEAMERLGHEVVADAEFPQRAFDALDERGAVPPTR